MTTMTHTQPATATDDTLEALGRAAGNFRAAYWGAVDRAEAVVYLPGTTPDEVAAANDEVDRLLTSWQEAEMALGAYRTALNMRSCSDPAVVFVSVEEYALSWDRVLA